MFQVMDPSRFICQRRYSCEYAEKEINKNKRVKQRVAGLQEMVIGVIDAC
jgi:hypothetical protein